MLYERSVVFIVPIYVNITILLKSNGVRVFSITMWSRPTGYWGHHNKKNTPRVISHAFKEHGP